MKYTEEYNTNVRNTENNKENTCQGCDRHCPITDLHCNKGRRLNGVAEVEGESEHSHHSHEGRGGRGNRGMHGHNEVYFDTEDAGADGLYACLRKCGHVLHHMNQEADTSALFTVLSEEEQETLKQMLEKLLKNWK